MPNWTDDEGNNWFHILQCKRCLARFSIDARGEVPVHDCLGGRYTSVSTDGLWHMPYRVSVGNREEWDKD